MKSKTDWFFTNKFCKSRSIKNLGGLLFFIAFFFLSLGIAQAALVDNNDGTVTDTKSGLTWQKQSDGIKRTWQQALDYTENLNLAGCTTWRLPNIKELKSIVDKRQSDPAIDTSYFVCESDIYWSSSPVGKTNKIWAIDFLDGKKAKSIATNAHFVRSVAGGCSLDKTSPEVISTSPPDGSTGVATTVSISATFNEAMDPATITESTFIVSSSAGDVAGTVTYSDDTAVFTPASELTLATVYTARITTEAQDLAGNGLSEDYQWSFVTTDTTPPSGSISIDGNAVWTNSTSVTLSLAATDDSGVVASMQLSNNGVDWNAWEDYLAVKSWKLETGDGTKTVYVRFKDASGNQSVDYSDTIILDTVGPLITINPVTSPTNTTAQTISGEIEENAILEVTIDTWATIECPPFSGTSWECTITGLAEGDNNITVKAGDEAGNFNSVTATIKVDTTAPSGSITINNGAEWTNSTSVTLNLAATDTDKNGSAGTVTSMQFSNDSLNWSAWENFASSKIWSVTPDEGLKTVYARFMDAAGNESDTATATIILDTTPPSITINTAEIFTNVDQEFIEGAMEEGVSLDVTVDTGAVTTLNTPTSTSWTCDISNLSTGPNIATVTATDAAGNSSSVTATIIYDIIAPTGSISINYGADVTNSTAVTLVLSAVDDSGEVASMRFSDDGSGWSTWEQFSSTKSWSLPSGDGEKTVFAQYMDLAGNESIAYSDTIILDTISPVITIDPIASPTNIASLTISGTRDSDDVIVSVSVPGAWVGPVDHSVSGVWQCAIILIEGENNITAIGTDAAGNQVSAAISIILDTIAEVTINPVTSPTNTQDQTISGTKEDSATIVVSVDTTATVSTITYPSTTTWECSLSNLAPGKNTITATATDDLDNTNNAVASITYDNTPPSGSVIINSDADSTNSTSVALTLSATDDSGSVVSMRFSNDGTNWSDWVSYATSESWYLTPGDGAKTVYAQFQDAAGNISSSASDTIILDTTAPSVTIDSVTSPTNVTTQTISGTREKDSTVSIDAPGGLASAVSYPSDTSWQCTVNLLEGTNVLTATATDSAGNTSSAIAYIILDTIAHVTIDPVDSPTVMTTQTITGSREVDTVIEITVNTTATVSDVEYPAATTWRCAISGLSAGDNVITATATDTLGNPGTATATITVDQTPPAGSVTINNGADATNSTSVTLTLSATDDSGSVVSMRFSNDGTNWSDWESYSTGKSWYLTLGDGTKTVYAQFQDAAGNISSSASDTIILDTTAPSVTIDPVTSPTNVTTQTISGAREAGSSISVSAAPAGLATGVTYPSDTTWQCTVNLYEGTNSVTVIATDGVGNTASAATSIILDTIAIVTIDFISSPTNLATQTISGTREPDASVAVTVNGTPQTQLTLTGNTTWQCDVTFDIEGDNTITVDSTDALGNTGSAGKTVVLDTIAPSVTIDPVISPTNDSTQTITGIREDGANIYVSGAYLMSLLYPTSDTWQCTLGLSEGMNNITVTAQDAAGNTGSDTTSILLDTIAEVTIDPVTSPTNDNISQKITGTKESGSTVSVVVDTTATVSGLSTTDTTWECTINDLVEGTNTITVTATDALSNTNSVSATIMVDTITPSLTIDPVISPTTESTQTISGTKSDDAYITVTAPGALVNSISYPDAISWQCTLTLAEGDNNITVTAADAAGNSSSANAQITLDTIAQVAFDPFSSPTNEPSQTISGTRDSDVTVSISATGASTDVITYPTATTWQCLALLTEGENIFTVTGVDSLGNIGSATSKIVLDTVVPTVTIDPVPDLTNEPSQIITGTRDSDAWITIAAPGASIQSISYPTLYSWKCSLTLAEGENTITATATDAAGNSSSASTQITLDTIAVVTIDPIRSPTNQSAQTLKGTREANADITVAGVSAGPVDLSEPTSWRCDITLAEGDNFITVTADDGINITSVNTTIVLDTTPPYPVFVTAADTLTGGTVELDWSSYDPDGTEGVSSYLVYASKNDFTDVLSMYPVKTLGPGTKKFTAVGLTNDIPWYFAVVAIDAAGNYNPKVGTASAIPTMQGIDGYVTDSDTGISLQGAVIQISDFSSVTTNEKGYYLKTGLVVGSYDLTVSGPGYVTGYASGVTVNSAQMTRLNIALVPEVQEPSVPQNVAAEAGDGQVTITWDHVGDLDLAGYNLYRFTSPSDTDPIKVNPDIISGNFYVDMDLTNGVTYYYIVRSVNDSGVESSDSEMVSATPQAGPPEPAADLEATLNADNSVTLTWEPSPTVGVSDYNIYWDGGTGIIDYTSPLATVSATATSWTSGALSTGLTYQFGLRAVKNTIEETNTSLVVSVTIPTAPLTGPQAELKKPKAGSRISGNRLTLRAELSQGSPADVAYVEFQYRMVVETDWSRVPAAVVPHPNPDADAPYKIHWEVSNLPEGNYELRAMAFDIDGSFDPKPKTVTVEIDHHKPGFVEFADEKVDHSAKKVVSRGKNNLLEFTVPQHSGSFEVSVPKDAINTDTAIVAEVPKLSEMADKIVGYPSIGRFLRLRLSSGQKQFAAGKEIEINIPYPDEDNDGIVDGYGVSASTLTILWYNPGTGQWENSGGSNVTVDTSAKKVRGYTSHFSDFMLAPTASDTDGDGLDDFDEINIYGTDPDNPDSDNDDLYDGEEVNTYGTNPLSSDTDYDGMPDGWEVTYSLDPLVDDAGLDADSDGVTNLEEYQNGTDPTVNESAQASTKVPVHNSLWLIPSMLTGLYLLRRRKDKSV